ncbi:hemin ABC transporter substrate-binding protein [Abyssibacter profundi]|uniref:Hemin ABC transporter substrate-binding protein n=2 Tax=Abyssibacter profundi TaxID=2182787 RepID=A0A363UM25_9GAMM|nr:hemin ABC transporter substrate-binding protein [Abyssibacter profundi]
MRTIRIYKSKSMNPSSLLLLRRRRLRLPPDRWMLALLAVVLCITALGHAPPASAAGTRLVTIGGAVTETVFALGAGSQVVAVDTSSTYPDAAQQRPKVGYARTLAAEGILAMRPDVVLAAAHAGPETVFTQLAAAGIEVIRVADPRSPDQALQMIDQLAEVLGRPDAGAQLRSRLQQQLDRLGATAFPAERGLVVMGGQGGQLLVAGQTTAADAMLGLVGLPNAAAALPGYRPVGDEGLLTMTPTIVIVPDHALAALGGLEGLRSRPALVGLDGSRFIVMESLLLLGMGPRLGEAVQSLAAAITRTQP